MMSAGFDDDLGIDRLARGEQGGRPDRDPADIARIGACGRHPRAVLRGEHRDSAVEMSAPYTLTVSWSPAASTARTAPLANSSYGAKIALMPGLAVRTAAAWVWTSAAVDSLTVPNVATFLRPGFAASTSSNTSLRR